MTKESEVTEESEVIEESDNSEVMEDMRYIYIESENTYKIMYLRTNLTGSPWVLWTIVSFFS